MGECSPLETADFSSVRGIFFDIDDTFTTNGKITSQAFEALWNLYESQLIVVPITGRPAGWCDHIARMWPVTAVIGENGAFYFMMDAGRLKKVYVADAVERDKTKTLLEDLKEEVLKKFPGASLSSDQNYREFDLAIDYCEDVKQLPIDDVKEICRMFISRGANAKISSIHINGWFGCYDKLFGCKFFIEKELGLNLDEHNFRFVFVGDSQNDEPMFKYFENSVGVANVDKFLGILKYRPRYITRGRSGEGFVELARKLVGWS